MLKDLYQK